MQSRQRKHPLFRHRATRVGMPTFRGRPLSGLKRTSPDRHAPGANQVFRFAPRPPLLFSSLCRWAGDPLPWGAAYDLTKIRGKRLVKRVPKSRRYTWVQPAFQTIAGLTVVRDNALEPLLACGGDMRRIPMPKKPSVIDLHYRDLRKRLRLALRALGVAA
jgi:hypothetical protein